MSDKKKPYVSHPTQIIPVDDMREDTHFVGQVVVTRKLRRAVRKRGIADMMARIQARPRT